MTINELKELKNISLSNYHFNELKELTEIYIDPTAPIEERINTLLDNIENPYIFKINGTVFRIKFSDNDKSLSDSINNYLYDLIESDN